MSLFPTMTKTQSSSTVSPPSISSAFLLYCIVPILLLACSNLLSTSHDLGVNNDSSYKPSSPVVELNRNEVDAEQRQASESTHDVEQEREASSGKHHGRKQRASKGVSEVEDGGMVMGDMISNARLAFQVRL